MQSYQETLKDDDHLKLLNKVEIKSTKDGPLKGKSLRKEEGCNELTQYDSYDLKSVGRPIVGEDNFWNSSGSESLNDESGW